MNGKETVAGKTARFDRKVKKRIIPFEFSDPITEPLFINFAHGSFIAGTAYLDIGVITLESFDPDTEGDEADFAVLTRLVMSKETLVLLRKQIDDLLAHTEEQDGS